MTDVTRTSTDPLAGKASALVVYLLYLLSVPSAGVLALVGVIWAYAVRGQASGWVLTHLDRQVKLFWHAVLWAIAIAVIGFLTLPFLGLGLFVWWGGGIVLTVWFAVVCLLGLLNLIGDRPA